MIYEPCLQRGALRSCHGQALSSSDHHLGADHLGADVRPDHHLGADVRPDPISDHEPDGNGINLLCARNERFVW